MKFGLPSLALLARKETAALLHSENGERIRDDANFPRRDAASTEFAGLALRWLAARGSRTFRELFLNAPSLHTSRKVNIREENSARQQREEAKVKLKNESLSFKMTVFDTFSQCAQLFLRYCDKRYS